MTYVSQQRLSFTSLPIISSYIKIPPLQTSSDSVWALWLLNTIPMPLAIMYAVGSSRSFEMVNGLARHHLATRTLFYLTVRSGLKLNLILQKLFDRYSRDTQRVILPIE